MDAFASSPLSSHLGLITFSVSFVLFGDRDLLELPSPGSLAEIPIPEKHRNRAMGLTRLQFIACSLFSIANIDTVANEHGVIPGLALDRRKLC